MADIFSSKRIEEMIQKASVGAEPLGASIDAADPAYRINLMNAFNWYNYEKDIKVARGYLKAWAKSQKTYDMKKFDAVIDNLTAPVYGWMARLLSHGAQLSDADLKNLHTKIADLMGQYRESKPVVVDDNTATVPGRRSIQEAMLEKQREFLGELEGEFDNFILNDCRPTDFEVFKYMQANNIAKQYAAALVDLFNERKVEYQEVLVSDDEQLLEAYGNYTKAQVKRVIQWLEDTVTGAERYANFKKANRKPVVRKAKPASVQVAKLQYLKETQVPGIRGEVKFTSVSPVQIVGAQQIWVYNVKNKKLGVYNAVGSAGFSVKGTSLQGWDPDTSVQRTLRKPDIVIQQCIDAGKVQLRKVLSDLTTSETKLNGRINADTIIVRVL